MLFEKHDNGDRMFNKPIYTKLAHFYKVGLDKKLKYNYKCAHTTDSPSQIFTED